MEPSGSYTLRSSVSVSSTHADADDADEEAEEMNNAALEPTGSYRSTSLRSSSVASAHAKDEEEKTPIESTDDSVENEEKPIARQHSHSALEASTLIEATATLVEEADPLATGRDDADAARTVHTAQSSVVAHLFHSSGELPNFKDQVGDDRPASRAPQILSSQNIRRSPTQEQRVQSAPENNTNNNIIDACPQVVDALMRDGFPDGLGRELARTKTTYPLRYWCVDNSASMYNVDCRRVILGKDGDDKTKMEVVKCTRWAELQESALYHAKLAGVLGATTTFRFLNNPPGTQQELVVNGEQDANAAIETLENMRPDGVSLLTRHVQSIHEHIAAIENSLINNGQKAVVVIATDAIPSNQFGECNEETMREFSDAIKALHLLPVWIIIRLCTNERSVLNYYRRLDKELERPIDVIGDILNEAKEVMRLNTWLNYSLPIHRAREMGYSNRLFDLLDERKLTKDELGEFLEVLFEKGAFDSAPNIHTDWSGFVAFFEQHVLSNEPRQWNPQTGKLERLIDVRKLKSAYMGGVVRDTRDALVDGVRRIVSKDVI